MRSSREDTARWISAFRKPNKSLQKNSITGKESISSGRKAFFEKIKEKCLDVLYPPRCPACGGILEDKQRSICPQCESIFHPVSEYYCMKCGKPVNETEEYCSECRHRERKFIRGRSVFLYNAQMKNSLLRYKYYGSREYGKYYAESMCRYVGRDIKSWRPDVIIPVPLHRRKKRMRGFNQRPIWQSALGKSLEFRLRKMLFISPGNTVTEKLDAEERKKNLRNAFQAAGPVTGLRILVVDDVYTTGVQWKPWQNVCWKMERKPYFCNFVYGKHLNGYIFERRLDGSGKNTFHDSGYMIQSIYV